MPGVCINLSFGITLFVSKSFELGYFHLPLQLRGWISPMGRRFRIGVDMHTVEGIHQGVRTHLLELYARAVQIAPELDFYLLGAPRQTLIAHSPAYDAANVHTVPMQHSGPLGRLLWQLPKLEKSLALDLLHTQYITPLSNSCKTAVTIHDILFESFPQYFTPFFRLRSSLLMRRSGKYADQVFTVSDFSRQELIDIYRIREGKILVTPNAADAKRFHPGRAGIDGLSKRGLEPGNYVLSVGRLEPRKNYEVLLRAYAAVPDAPPLVIVGQRDFGFHKLFSLMQHLSIENKVRILEDVGTDELSLIYRHALIFVYPSVAEGFGMPVMEAFSSGVPVICSDSTALTEIARSAALTVEPNSVESLRDALFLMLTDGRQRTYCANAGLQRAREYSWQNSAEVLVRGLHAALIS
jgi:glycosyltransferase involved in cell wall biosynthesis